jgi:hypothetical protein
MDLELPEDAAEVSLDRVLGNEQRLRDLAVRHSFGGQTRDAQFRGGKVAAALGGVSARAGTGSDELIVGARGDRVRAAETRQFERLAEWLAGLGAATGAAGCGAQLDERERVLEPSRRTLQMRDRFLDELDSRVTLLDKAKRSQGRAERSLRAEGAATLDLLARERTSLVEAAE